MALKITEIHRAEKPKLLNTEWFVLENTGDAPLSLRGSHIGISKPHARKVHTSAKLDPGFKLDAGEKKRLVSGNPRSKVQGSPPEDEIENYHLFLKVALLSRPGEIVKILRGQMHLSQAVWDPEAENGVGAPVEGEKEEK
jgi:hypothetical protein